MLERIIARLGWLGLVTLALAASILVNVWQFKRLSKAESACDARISSLEADVARKTAELEKAALAVGRETTARAQDDAERINTETVKYVDRIRRVTVEVPANCPRALPDRVQDALSDAARSANR